MFRWLLENRKGCRDGARPVDYRSYRLLRGFDDRGKDPGTRLTGEDGRQAAHQASPPSSNRLARSTYGIIHSAPTFAASNACPGE